MAIAPVNKFISIAVPVAPGLQKLYEVPTGASALILYAQVANVGIGTFPTVTFIQRRESRSTKLTRDIRVIKDAEIPPNDAVVLVDGRLVLEKTPTTLDRIFISGVQSGVSTVTDVTYHEPLGVATVTTVDSHGFLKGDQITMGGIAFTCSNNNSGITTTIFPDPQASYTVIDVRDNVSFIVEVGTSNGINQLNWRPNKIYHYIQWNELKPDFVVDISSTLNLKMKSVMEYKSQFYNPKIVKDNTPISSKNFIEIIRYRALNLGRLVGVEAAEGFNVERFPSIKSFDDLN